MQDKRRGACQPTTSLMQLEVFATAELAQGDLQASPSPVQLACFDMRSVRDALPFECDPMLLESALAPAWSTGEV